MNIRRGCVALAIAALLANVMPTATAAAAHAWGYWWRLQSGVGPVIDAPPFVPDQGLWISSDPSGPQAVSALRFAASADESATTLVLNVADSQGSGASLRACPTVGDWEPVEAGAWDARPDGDCDRSVAGRASRNGETWSFDVSSLMRGPELDIVLLPGSGTFSLAFDKPGPRTIGTEHHAAEPEPAPAPGPGTEPVPVEPPARVFPRPQAVAAPPAGQPAEALGRDIPAYPAPPATRDRTDTGGRPIALLASVVVAAAWIWRDRAAERAAGAHELAQPLALERDASVLRRAESALTASPAS